MMSREDLSAWMDGELPGDEGRFVSKRLMHDDALQAQVSRWTGIGDALRELEVTPRHNAAVAPVGFLDRVRVAIDQERAQVHAPCASEVAIAREQTAMTRSRMQSFKFFAQKPSSIAASVTLLAAVVVLLRLGPPLNNELLTSLTMQNAATPTADSIRKAGRQASAQNSARTAANATPRVNRVNTRIATPAQTVAQVRQVNTVASAPTTVQSLPPRVSSTFTNARPNVVASNSDPFGLGSSANHRVISGATNRAWPKARVSGSPRTMNASFSGASGGASVNDPFAPNAHWPMQMSLGASRGE